MNKILFGRPPVLWLMALVVLGLALTPTLAAAQQVPAPPVHSTVDENGVDLTSGQVLVSHTGVAIGPQGDHGLSFTREWVQNGWRYVEVPTISGDSSNPTVSFRGESVAFQLGSGGYVPRIQNGASLTLGSTTWQFVSSDGMQITFNKDSSSIYGPMASNLGQPTAVAFPDGTAWTYYYNTYSYSVQEMPPQCYPFPPSDPTFAIWCNSQSVSHTYSYARLSSFTSSTGYQIKLVYQTDSATPSTVATWQTLSQVKAINNSVEYCSPTATCSLAQAWPTASYSATTATDASNGTTTYAYTNGQLSGITPPGASTPALTIGYTSGKVTSLAVGGGTWIYNYPSSTQTTVTDPNSQVRTVNYNSDNLVTSTIIGGKTTIFTYNGLNDPNGPQGLLQTVEMPEHNKVTYRYDARGNVQATTYIGKTGSPSIVTSAVYPSTCTNVKTCNKPTSTTDGRGQSTIYDWNPGNGELNSVTMPADASGVHPQIRVTYGSLYAWYKNSSGTLVQGPAISMPISISQCRTLASCAGTANEKLTAINYPASGASNALPSSVTIKAGDNTLVATTAIAYDNLGDVVSVDGPLPGAADTAVAFYNLARQKTGEIGPDPDDSGAAKFPATSYSYRPDGQLDHVDTGTVDVQSSAWTGWNRTNVKVFGYDSYGRKAREALYDGGPTTAYAMTDVVYDTAGRVLCTLQRMNQGQFASLSLPTSCTPTSGPQWSDRVTYNHYDALGRVDQVITGYGTGDAATEQTLTFTDNGQIATVTDAENNKTTYEYDGFDRLIKTRFPDPSKGLGQSSTTDFELIGYYSGGIFYPGYDANGNVTDVTTRRGERLTLTYDNLNRPTHKAVPARTGLPETYTRHVHYSYDLFGDLSSACFGIIGSENTASSDCINNTYDALGQMTGTTQNLDGYPRSLTYQHDAAGNRTRLYYPDSTNYVNYHRTGAGALYYTDLNGSPLFYPPYDAAGRVSALYRLNTSTGQWENPSAFQFDPASRPNSLNTDIAGTSYDTTSWWSYNPANQITSFSRNNDAYAWTGSSSVSRSYVGNGLNQYSSATSTVAGVPTTTTYGYDANGNLTSDGTTTYIYDVENRLIGRDGSASTRMRYDPLGRLYEVSDSVSGITRFLYDDDDLVGEYNSSGTMLRRYVHGDSSGDDPQVWFEGSGVTDAARRYLYADERGSIVAVTDSAGNIITNGTNTYDEYGIPGAVNQGRFQYTGQAWIPELGMYYYKARMYSPTLGRFMQTDPIGYGDGMNMYRYAANDPVNGVDPSGLDCESPSCWLTVTAPDTVTPPHGVGFTGSANDHAFNGGDDPRYATCHGDQGCKKAIDTYLSWLSQKPQKPQNGNDIVVTGRKIISDHPILTGIAIHWICGLCGFVYDGYQIYQWWNTPEPCCFTAGTLVDTPSGQKAIETLKTGDRVISRDPKTGKTATKPIVGITPAHERRIWKLTVSYKSDGGQWRDEQYETTDDHPWRTVENKWVVTASLKQGQLLAREHGTAVVANVINTGSTKLTYNLEIADFHTYFVGNAGTWVHNSCDPRPNSVQNRQAADARKQAERITGMRFTKAQQREFHDRITGERMSYQELVDEAVRVLRGQ